MSTLHSALLCLLRGTAALLALLAPTGWAQAMGVRSGSAPGNGSSTEERGEYVPGEVIVKFRTGVPQARIEALLGELKLEVRKSLGMGGTYLLRITDGSAVPDTIERLGALEEVEYAEPNRITRLEPRPGAPGAKPLQPLKPGG